MSEFTATLNKLKHYKRWRLPRTNIDLLIILLKVHEKIQKMHRIFYHLKRYKQSSTFQLKSLRREVGANARHSILVRSTQP